MNDTLGIPVFKEVSVSQSEEQPPKEVLEERERRRQWAEQEKEFQKKQRLYAIGLILIVILFIYVAVSGGILKVITGTVVLTPIIFFIWVFMSTGGTIDNSGSGALIIFLPIVAVFTFSILTIIMAIYNFISNFTTPTPSTIV